jgi:hypothetical protein
VIDDSEPTSFLARRPPPVGRVRIVVLRPARSLEYRREHWADALVIVERGTLEVELTSGDRARFGSGAILAFATVEPRRLNNPGACFLVISALTR